MTTPEESQELHSTKFYATLPSLYHRNARRHASAITPIQPASSSIAIADNSTKIWPSRRNMMRCAETQSSQK